MELTRLSKLGVPAHRKPTSHEGPASSHGGARAASAASRIGSPVASEEALSRAPRRGEGRVPADRCPGQAAAGRWESIDGRTLSAALMSTPVATTDTRMMPSRLSSKVAPTMMLASASTSSRMRVAASSTS
jgi:hypothetical protein